MSLHKPGKEHTINFIYCWAALHPDPSRRSAPYSQRLGEACLWVRVRGRRVWRWARAFLDWGGNPRNAVGGSGPLFLPAAPQSPVHVALRSPRRPSTSQWEKPGLRHPLYTCGWKTSALLTTYPTSQAAGRGGPRSHDPV